MVFIVLPSVQNDIKLKRLIRPSIQPDLAREKINKHEIPRYIGLSHAATMNTSDVPRCTSTCKLIRPRCAIAEIMVYSTRHIFERGSNYSLNVSDLYVSRQPLKCSTKSVKFGLYDMREDYIVAFLCTYNFNNKQ